MLNLKEYGRQQGIAEENMGEIVLAAIEGGAIRHLTLMPEDIKKLGLKENDSVTDVVGKIRSLITVLDGDIAAKQGTAEVGAVMAIRYDMQILLDAVEPYMPTQETTRRSKRAVEN